MSVFFIDRKIYSSMQQEELKLKKKKKKRKETKRKTIFTKIKIIRVARRAHAQRFVGIAPSGCKLVALTSRYPKISRKSNAGRADENGFSPGFVPS